MDVKKFILAFSSGFTIMTLEMVGARMLAPYFGNSTYVWGSVIGVFMIALAIGYRLGGTMADRWNNETGLFTLIMGGIFLSFVLGASYSHILPFFSGYGDIKGSIITSLLLFGPPTALLAVTSPYLIKLLAKRDNVGQTAGNIYAVSTGGSIFGTFATAFFLIPMFGTKLTLFATFAIFLLVTLFTLGQRKIYFISLLLLLFYLVPANAIVIDGWVTVYEAESEYNFIQVLHKEGVYKLRLNKDNSFHTIQEGGSTSTDYYYDYMLLAPILKQTERLLILGAGAGANVNQLLERFPGILVEAVEIDSKVIQAGEMFFGLDTSNPRLEVYVGDARPFVKKNDRTYEVVFLDIYSGGFHIPFYVMTLEYFQEIKELLPPDGILVINIISVDENSNRDYTLVDPIANTLSRVFGNIYSLDIGINTLLYASNSELSLSDVEADAILEHLKFQYVEYNFKKYKPTTDNIFTDDKSNLDMLTNQMLGDT